MSEWPAFRLAPPQQKTDDELLAEWHAAKAALDAAKDREMALRKAIAERHFANKPAGTHRMRLDDQYDLKAGIKENISFDKDFAKIGAARLRLLTGVGNYQACPQEIVDSVFVLKVELNTSAYRKLTPEWQAVIADVVTIKPGAPSLDIVPKKEDDNGAE